MYLDNYDKALQFDPDVDANYAEAIALYRENNTPFYGTIWSMLPPVIAIVLALITKEVYSSLFVGILAGALLNTNFNIVNTITTVVNDGFTASLADAGSVGILIFLVVLGALVAMMNKSGGSAAFGRWASKNIKSRVGAQLATVLLGCLIFVDDYFNCLTVGSVMRPVSDAHKVSRAKLAYLIDATAAPICIIAPISSWAAAVSGFAEGSSMNGLELFVSAIPFNFYAILTVVMMVLMAIMKFEYGPMKLHEKNAKEKGDIFTNLEEKAAEAEKIDANPNGKVIDLIFPVVVLIISCVIFMIYTGGFFDGVNFVDAFSGCDPYAGLAMGSVVALAITVLYFMFARFGLIKITKLMESIPEGFKAMVPAILILTFAWTLNSMTSSLGAAPFIANIVQGSASSFMSFLPAIIFLIAVGLSFSTGTSWGTFGILIPIVLTAFQGFDNSLTIVAVSACMAGAVCGDHCSPISDTTIMASAGAQCNHMDHVATQLPYALTSAAVSFVAYIIAGFIPNAFIALPIAIVLMVATLFGIKTVLAKKK
ncbi:MAG: Na+/H+ antiporter NhaC family protein [Ruminococcaceae bacterium]|nr:Na+/H+ antiporter NhaC family protein [Oscillospiraceae bacterium]